MIHCKHGQELFMNFRNHGKGRRWGDRKPESCSFNLQNLPGSSAEVWWGNHLCVFCLYFPVLWIERPPVYNSFCEGRSGNVLMELFQHPHRRIWTSSVSGAGSLAHSVKPISDLGLTATACNIQMLSFTKRKFKVAISGEQIWNLCCPPSVNQEASGVWVKKGK